MEEGEGSGDSSSGTLRWENEEGGGNGSYLVQGKRLVEEGEGSGKSSSSL